MRFFAVFGVVLLLGLGHPAWAFLEGMPGDKRWPEIPGRAGMEVVECQVSPVFARQHQAIWNFSDGELAEFWKPHKFCNPALTEKSEGGSYWGGDWQPFCYYHRADR